MGGAGYEEEKEGKSRENPIEKYINFERAIFHIRDNINDRISFFPLEKVEDIYFTKIYKKKNRLVVERSPLLATWVVV